MVKIFLGNIYSKIVGYLPDTTHEKMDKVLSYRLKNARHMKIVKMKKWDGVYHLYKKNQGQSFYTGLLSLATEVLKSENEEYVIVDERIKPEQNLPNLTFIPPPNFEARPYQDFTIDRALKATRGIIKIGTGGGKCLGRGTKVIMFDGSVKNVEDIKKGELLMGPDSKPRIVKSVCYGRGELYRVKQKNGDDFICNDEHILCLQRTTCASGKWNKKEKEEIEIKASDFYLSSKRKKHIYKGFKVGVEFDQKDIQIDPYWLGIWLGDGNSDAPAITTGDKEIVDYIYKLAKKVKLSIREADGHGCKTYYFVKNLRVKNKKCSYEGCENKSYCRGMCEQHYKKYKQFIKNYPSNHFKNPFTEFLRSNNLIKNKHIPNCYKFNSRKFRLNLLAGLIDSDGSFSKTGSVEFYNTNKVLAEDVLWLARSLGFRSSLNTKKDAIKSTGYKRTSFRVRISGKISDVPILVKRKQAGDKTKYAALRYGISLLPIGKGEYFGFEIDGDGKFLLGDFTVAHNTMVNTELIAKLKVAPLMFYVLTKDLMDQAHEMMSSSLNEPIGIIGGGEFNPKKINVCTIQTAVNALNMDNKYFNISDYKFDEEDNEWEESKILSVDKKKYLKELIGSTRALFVDEMHHAGARTVRDVLSASPSAYYRYGLTATPWREDGAEIVLQAMFGKKIVDISSSYLIEKGYLVKPYVIFDPIKDNCKFHQYQTIYKDCIVKNDLFNTRIVEIAKYLRGKGLSVLILVQQIPQGEYIKNLLPDVSFVTSKMTRKNRQEALNEIRTGAKNTVVATSLFDEGINVPCLDVVLMAGGGASSTRVYQRIGRSLRKHGENKDKALVVYFEHDAKHLKDHAKKARRIIKAEPKFEIVDSAGGNFIYNEIDEIFGFNNQRNTILDI